MAGLILNDDFMRFVASKYHENYKFGEVGEQDVRDAVRILKDTTVTDYVFNVNAQMSYSPSKVWMTAEDKYNTTEENGHEVDYHNTFYKVWYDIFVLQQIDMYQIWIEELNQMGIHPWISFRINDVHDHDKRYGGIRRSVFFDKGRENGFVRTQHRDKAAYFDDCLDFKHKEVRDYHLAYMEEQLMRYDVYGAELDFMREPFLCSPGEEEMLCGILLEFFRDVKKIIKKAEQKFGHPIKLSLRCLRDIRTALDSGLDVYALVREKLVDMLIPSPRYLTCDNDMPLYEWKKAFEGEQIELAAGADLLYLSCARKNINLKDETVAALAMQYQTNGADYIYLYNYTYLEKPEMYKVLGDVDRLAKLPRRHIVSFQDLGYLHTTVYNPLPITLNAGYQYLRIQTGRIDKGSKVILRLGCDKPLTRVYVNSSKCIPLGTETIEEEYYPAQVQVFQIEKYNQKEQIVEVSCIEGATLSYAEILILPE